MSEPLRVLILDDEFLIAMALAEDLEDEGFDIVGPFSTVEKATAGLENSPVDIALLDVNLGNGRTSFDLARRLREKGIPFAFLTGYGSLTSAQSEFHDSVFLTKPVSTARVVQEIRKLTTAD